MKIRKIAIITCALALLTACGSDQNTKTNNMNNTQTTEGVSADKKAGKLNIVTSTYFLKDLAEEIAGDKATVTNIVPKNSGVHGFEPTPKDMNLLNDADIFIYNGAGLESWVDTVEDSLGENVETVEASDDIKLIAGGHHDHDDDHDDYDDRDDDHDDYDDRDDDHDDYDDRDDDRDDYDDRDDDRDDYDDRDDDRDDYDDRDDDHDHDDYDDRGGKDPHVWMSPKNAKQMARNIAEELIEEDPVNKDYYQENLKTLEEKLDTLDQSFRDALEGAKNRDIVVSHEAYGYLAKEYGLNQIPIEGINSETEPDPKAMKDIIDRMKEKNIKVIFTEPNEDDKIAQTIASETGAEVKELDPLEYENDQTYLERMEQNLKVLETALK